MLIRVSPVLGSLLLNSKGLLLFLFSTLKGGAVVIGGIDVVEEVVLVLGVALEAGRVGGVVSGRTVTGDSSNGR